MERLSPVRSAFVAAGLADLGSDCAEVLGKLRFPGHLPGSKGADVCARFQKLQTVDHFADTFFCRALGGAGLAGGNASVARVDAFKIFHGSDGLMTWALRALPSIRACVILHQARCSLHRRLDERGLKSPENPVTFREVGNEVSLHESDSRRCCAESRNLAGA